MPNELTLHSNGTVEVLDPTTHVGIPTALKGHLAKRDIQFIQRQRMAIGKLAEAEHELLREQKRLEEELANDPRMQKIRALKAKRKVVEVQIRDSWVEVRGVLESVVQEYMPGKRLVDLYAEEIETPEPAPRGRPRLNGGAKS